METKYIEELAEVFNGVFYVVEYDKYPEDTEVEISRLKNKYFGEDQLAWKLYRDFKTQFRISLYSLPDLHSRKAFITETLHILFYDDMFEEKEISRFMDKMDENGIFKNTNDLYNKGIIYEYANEVRGLLAFVHCDIGTCCEYFDFDYDKIYDKVAHLDNFDSDRKNKEYTFPELFKLPYNSDIKIKDLKDILKTSGYIDNNYKWVGITKEKTELATLYWLFQDKENILKSDKVTQQLKTFYKEFGLIAYTDKEPSKGYCTIRTISTHTGENQTYKEFERLFYNWISKE
jgi:hypothetical protein